MKKTLISAVLAATFGLVAMQASAADGTLTFNGTITDTTCTVKGGGAASGQGAITVQLPTVSTTSLSKDGATAGDTAFSLILTCSGGSPAGKTAALWIETSQTPLLDTATGALKNQAGGASNVEVQMVNPANSQPILLNINNFVTNGATVIAGSNQPAATIAGTTATLNYLGRYLAKGGAASAGAVTTMLTYSMQYN